MHIEHIIPRARGGISDETNLWLGLTPVGRATVVALRMNNEFIVAARTPGS